MATRTLGAGRAGGGQGQGVEGGLCQGERVEGGLSQGERVEGDQGQGERVEDAIAVPRPWSQCSW